MLKLIVSNRSKTPIYEQIKDQIIEAIMTDVLKENDLLPSIRQLAKDLKISVITTTRAYKDLEEEGYVVNVQGKGCYVLAKNENLNYETGMRNIESLFYEAIALQKRINIDDETLIEVLKTIMEVPNHE